MSTTAPEQGRRRRGVPPSFDYSECRLLYATGLWTQAELGALYGVTASRISQVVNPQTLERLAAASRARQRSLCSVCGAPCSWNSSKQAKPRCRRCYGLSIRTRFRFDSLGALEAVRCVLCKEWKPPHEYCRNPSRPHGLHQTCRACQTATRRDYRHAHLEQSRAYTRDRYRRLGKIGRRHCTIKGDLCDGCAGERGNLHRSHCPYRAELADVRPVE